MVVKQYDFIEIEFTGTITDTREMFDTNIKDAAQRGGLSLKDLKPFQLSVGHNMLPPGFEKDIIGKEIGVECTVHLAPEDAFGKRRPDLVKMIPTKLFHEQNIHPARGMQLNLDGRLTRVLSNSGGRTLVDFNNPLAGKKVTYTYKILRELPEKKDHINALQEFFFKKQFPFTVEGTEATLHVPKEFEPFVTLFAPQFKEIAGITIKAHVSEELAKSQEIIS